MRLRLAALPVAMIACAGISTPAQAQKSVFFDGRPSAGPNTIDSQYICVFREGAVGRGQAGAEAARAANPEGGQVTHVYENSIHGFAVHMSAQGLVHMSARNPNIAFCEADQVITLGKPGGGGGGGGSTETIPWGVQRVGGGTTASTHLAWIIDTGVDLDHPELKVNTALSKNCVSSGRDTGPDDLNGHGTHVAGIIAAKKNGTGVVGVAPGTTVVSVRVLDRRGSGAYSDVICGVDYVAAHGTAGDVANMSLGGPVSAALDAAVLAASANVKFAIAAGNDGADANGSSPAHVNGPNIYTISAIDSKDALASWSNYGNPPVDFAEPGVSILSTWMGGGYNTISGTSMAAPHAAGILLLGAIHQNGTATNDKDGTPDPIGHL